ncbi:MAG: hypothetical protein ACWIPH_01810, partial [Ostreibacterium sp.]
KQQQNKQQQNKQQQNKQQQNKQQDLSALPQWENKIKQDKSNQDSTKIKQRVLQKKPVLDQATEQQLRRVPDDLSGLLRARIRQYYYRQNIKRQMSQ